MASRSELWGMRGCLGTGFRRWPHLASEHDGCWQRSAFHEPVCCEAHLACLCTLINATAKRIIKLLPPLSWLCRAVASLPQASLMTI